MKKETAISWVLKPTVHLASLYPAALLLWLGYSGQLGPNPIEFIHHHTGDWALRFLLLSLAITPLRGLTGLSLLTRFRRMIGLYAFFYAVLHVTNYVVIDLYFDWEAIWRDIVKRTYITVGMLALLIMVPLAITSTKGMVKRLGGKRWQMLHKSVYVAGIASCIHFIMMRKGFQYEPLIYAGICAALLGYRLAAHLKKRADRAAKAAAAKTANAEGGAAKVGAG